MRRKLSKKGEKVIKKVIEEGYLSIPRALVVKAGARMMLQVAMERRQRNFKQGLA